MAAEYVPYGGPIVTRAEAKAAGFKRYFTGKPCRAGHICERWRSTGHCRLCFVAYMRERNAANPEPSRRYAQEWRQRNPDKVRALNAASYASDVEWHRQRSRDYAKSNARKRAEYLRKKRAGWTDLQKRRAYLITRRWMAEHPVQNLALKRNRRARVRNAQGAHTAADILDILRQQRGKCAWCRQKLGAKYHVDHVVALVNGGRNDKANLVLACQPCNSRKSSKDPLVFARERGLLI